MNNIDFLIKQQTIYTSKQKEFFQKKNLQVEIDEYQSAKIQVVTSPNKSTKFVLQMQEADQKQVTKALENQFMIEILELKECRLKAVPEEIFKMQKLRVLKLEGNFIKIAPVIEVEVLSLKNNLLLHYKSGEQVRVLDLSMNKIQEFSLGEKLEELCVVANEFTILPKLPQSIQKLELDWFKYTEPPLEQTQRQPLINLLTYEKVNCIDFLNMFSENEPKNKIIEAALAQDLGVLSSLAANMNINIEDENGDTALSQSLKTDNLFAVRHLIELGASIELGSYQQGSILSFALESNLPTIVNLIFPKLKNCSFRQDIYGNSPLHYLCKFDYDDISTKILIKAKSLNIEMGPNVYGQTPIHLAISKSKNWLLSLMLKYYRIDSEDLFNLAARYDNIGAIVLLISNQYYFEGTLKLTTCRNLKIYRLLKQYEIMNMKMHLLKPVPKKNNFNYEVKLINNSQYRNFQNKNNLKNIIKQELSIEEMECQMLRSSNYIKLLRQYILFEQMLSKQQRQYLLTQMIQRIKELANTTQDQLAILSDILLTLHFKIDKQFIHEVQKNYQQLQVGQHYLFHYFLCPKPQNTLLQYEQYQC